MKRVFVYFLFVILCSVSLIACSNKEGLETTPTNVIQEGIQEPSTASTVDDTDAALATEQYYSPDHGEKIITENTITWIEGDVTILAKKTKTSIESINIRKGSLHQTIDINEAPSNISSVAISADKEYLALCLFYQNVGNKVIVTSLSDGMQITLNNQTGEKNIETIHTFNWSPKENILSFAYGNTESSKIGLYYAATNTFQTIPGEYITTLFILWNKEGDTLNFVSEKPSDRFTLFRLKLNSEKVETINDILKEDLAKFNDFVPESLKN
jgi:hypothetical protein